MRVEVSLLVITKRGERVAKNWERDILAKWRGGGAIKIDMEREIEI